MSELNIFIGYDPAEDEAYNVAKYSFEKNAGVSVNVRPIKLSELSKQEYFRQRESSQSTEFTYSRFLTAYLSKFKDWALFVDCDVWCNSSLEELLTKYNDRNKSIYCVKHDYETITKTKMDGLNQSSNLPRKNWSSVMWFNCEHEYTMILMPRAVNTQSPAYLHQLQWAKDKVGELPLTYNFLCNEYPKPSYIPKICHATLGGPWFNSDECINCDFAELYYQYYYELYGKEHRNYQRYLELNDVEPAELFKEEPIQLSTIMKWNSQFRTGDD